MLNRDTTDAAFGDDVVGPRRRPVGARADAVGELLAFLGRGDLDLESVKIEQLVAHCVGSSSGIVALKMIACAISLGVVAARSFGRMLLKLSIRCRHSGSSSKRNSPSMCSSTVKAMSQRTPTGICNRAMSASIISDIL